MAEKAKNAAVEVAEDEELNLDVKVNVKNLSNWEVAFNRIQEGMGAVRIMPGGSQRLTRGEIIAQVQNGNKLFAGIDGMGSHANIYIDDKATRVELGFEDDDREQQILTLDSAKKLLVLPQAKYESKFNETIVTRSEKHAIMDFMRQLNINDYAKIRFAEIYTHCKL